MAAQEPNTSTGRDVRALRLVSDGLTSSQEPPKGFPIIDVLALCGGPTGPCVREAFHGGDHIRPEDSQRRAMLVAAKLLRSTTGNPGWAARQAAADSLFALLGGE